MLARRSRESGYGIEVYGTAISEFLRELHMGSVFLLLDPKDRLMVC